MPLERAVWHDPQTGLHFLPAAAGMSGARTARVLAPARAERLLAALRANYDRVIIDLPAIGSAADASVMTDLFDGLLLVSAWGGLEGEALAEMLNSLHDGRDKLLGVLLNRVEMRRLGQYGVTSYRPTQRQGADAAA